MGKSLLALPVTLAGIAGGILVADTRAVPHLGVAIVAGALLMAGGAAGRRGAWIGLIGLALAAAAVGAWRGDTAAESVEGSMSVATLADGADHDLVGTIVDDPRPREDRLQLVLADLATERGGRVARLSDRLLVWLPRGVDARAGDRLRIDGEL